MSSFYDNEDEPQAQRVSVAGRAKAFVDEHAPIFFNPDYNQEPEQKMSEVFFLGFVMIVLFIAVAWGLGSLDRGDEPSQSEQDRTEAMFDQQAYDDIRYRPFIAGGIADWDLDGDVDHDDREYFDETVYYLPYEQVLALAAEAADSTFPELADG